MKNIIPAIVLFSFTITSCIINPRPKQEEKPADENTVFPETDSIGEYAADSLYGDWDHAFRQIAPTSIIDNAVKLIGKDWMLITAGTDSTFNTMTASWGALGEMWAYLAAFITVRNTRYTHEFLNDNEYFTLSFLLEDYRDVLRLLGSKSGRNSDKISESGLTPIGTLNGSVSFAESRMIIECRKIYSGQLRPQDIQDEYVFDNYYKDTPKEYHTLFIGEIVGVWLRSRN